MSSTSLGGKCYQCSQNSLPCLFALYGCDKRVRYNEEHVSKTRKGCNVTGHGCNFDPKQKTKCCVPFCSNLGLPGQTCKLGRVVRSPFPTILDQFSKCSICSLSCLFAALSGHDQVKNLFFSLVCFVSTPFDHDHVYNLFSYVPGDRLGVPTPALHSGTDSATVTELRR